MSDTVREFSRKVQMRLFAGAHDIEVSQFGGEFLITGYPFSVQPCLARMSIRIDDELDEFEVNLIEGIDPGRVEQPIILQTR